MLKSLVLSGLLASGVGAFASAPFDNQSLYSPTTQAVIYDDENYKITLSVDEVNNYHFDNLYTLTENEGINEVFNTSQIVYNNQTANYDTSFSTWGYSSIDTNYTWKFNYNETYSNQFIRYQFYGYLNKLDIEYDVDLIISSTYYASVKSAIELDIEANQPPQPSAGFITALVSFVTLLTSGIVALATGIASGVVGMAKALFLNSTATGLSIFGGLIALFAGITLAVTLTTKVYQWITSLGN